MIENPILSALFFAFGYGLYKNTKLLDFMKKYWLQYLIESVFFFVIYLSIYKNIDVVLESSVCAVLMISHDLHVVMSASNRVICLNGHICCQGEPQSVASSPEYRDLFGSNIDGTFALYQHNHKENKSRINHSNA